MVRPWLTVDRWRRDRRVLAPRGRSARAAADRMRCENAGDGRRRHAVLHADDHAVGLVAARDCNYAAHKQAVACNHADNYGVWHVAASARNARSPGVDAGHRGCLTAVLYRNKCFDAVFMCYTGTRIG